ncbi:MAG: putative cadmium-transporting ATPase [Chlamydiae bacterium]|nr:putative cadmium-transporting ATPase [Chlamydiota bacterium]
MNSTSRTIPRLFPSATTGVEQFDEFFDSGMEESISPFLMPDSRKWGENIRLKASIFAAFLLFFSLIFSFFPGGKTVANLLLLFTYFFVGVPALIASIEDLLSLEINIDVLMTLAAFLSVLIGSGIEGALLLVLFAFSGSLEEAVRSKAKGTLSSLKKLSPQKAYVVEPNGSLKERSVKDLVVGTPIHIKAGQIVPLDGEVIEGASSVNLVHLTGENLPQTKTMGDEVPAGARNLEGAITLRVTRTSSESTLSRIIELITQAQEAKPKLQRWLDKVSKGYAMTIIGLSLLFALSFPWLFSIPYLGNEGSIYRALTFLIAASPCALILAVPIAYLSAVSACARQGILLKGGVILDALSRCDTLAMDKTGTLTTGILSCLGIESFGGSEDLLPLAYTMERSALHPIAQAISDYAQKREAPLVSISDFKVVPGYGLEATYIGKRAEIGNKEWIFPKIPPSIHSQVAKRIKEIHEAGELVTLLLYEKQLSIFRFSDSLRPEIRETIGEIQNHYKMRVMMLTGDHQQSAGPIAKAVGIEEVYADLRPEDKLKIISETENLVMIGDGINDAPALARAHVGISMGKVGSTTAIDASDIIFLHDNIEQLGWLIEKSHQVTRIVKQNLGLAGAAIIFASIPALLGWIPLYLAVILHEGGTVVVGLNALRLLRTKRGAPHVDSSTGETERSNY